MDARAPNFSVQEHTLRQQAMELDVALKELQGAQSAYRFVGGLLIAKNPEELRAELTAKRESVQERLNTLARAAQK